ncbi:MAG: hypothetical protein QXY49_07320 [Thermofilaceae archaeon]
MNREHETISLYRILIELLSARLKDPFTFSLAERLLKVYEERGHRGLKEEIERILAEVVEGAIKTGGD